MTADVTLVGLGIRVPDHATRETERALRACREVLFVDTGVATRPWLESLAPKVTDLWAEGYREGGPRTEVYHHQAARVLEAALDHGPVVFAMQGHPLVYAQAPRLVRRAAPLLGLSVDTLPGISSLDTLFADLGLDPCDDGLQMVEATDLLLRRRPLRPDMGLLVWQVGTLGTRLHSEHRSLPGRFDPLREHLMRFYPPDHPVTIYFAPPLPLVPPLVHTVPLSRLGADPDRLHPGVTLYLRPAGRRPIEDLDLQALLDDPTWLARSTR